MKKLTILAGLILLLVWSGSVLGADSADVNNTVSAGSSLSTELPEHSD